MHREPFPLIAVGVSLILLSCSNAPTGPEPVEPITPGVNCSINTDLVFDGGVGVDGIPALTNPPWPESSTSRPASCGKATA